MENVKFIYDSVTSFVFNLYSNDLHFWNFTVDRALYNTVLRKAKDLLIGYTKHIVIYTV